MNKTNPDQQKAPNPQKKGALPVGRRAVPTALRAVGKTIVTVLMILLISLVVVGIALLMFIFSMRDEKVSPDLMTSFKQNYSSTLYVNGDGDDTKNPVEQLTLKTGPERIWVDYQDIPDNMKNAMVAIEDKRFWKHHGVDWRRTAGAVLNLLKPGGSSFGGSSITQQLIKNLTQEDDISVTRKIKEIFRAQNLEKEYSKEQILEAYLNVAQFGPNIQGVQAAAQLYFGKDIAECDLAQCAAIAGITQSPAKYNPLVHPDNNKDRQQVVLKEMYSQGMISETDYEAAMQESEHMTFVGKKASANTNQVWDWYTDAVISDVQQALMDKYKCSASAASNMIYSNGLQIYSAVDSTLQKQAEDYVLNKADFGDDSKMQTGVAVVGYDGRVLALVGGRNKKTANRVNSFATTMPQQTGSSNKPIGVYAPAIEAGVINYSSLVEDEPFAGYYNDGTDREGPLNYSLDNQGGTYHGMVPAQKALAGSYNAAAVNTLKKLGIDNSFNFLTQKLGFASQYVDSDKALAPLALGGLTNGVSVESMAAAYAIFGNGGKYYKPYTFYKVLDHDGNVLIDNTTQSPTQALSPVTASIMNRMLRTVVTEGTGRLAAISGWDVVGKTGTSNDYRDSWFIGDTPYAVCAVWTGYENENTRMRPTDYSKGIFKGIMTQYLSDKEDKDFTLDSGMVERDYCVETGLLAGPGCSDTAPGYYDANNLPATDDGGHSTYWENRESENGYRQNRENGNINNNDSTSEQPEENNQGASSQQPASEPPAESAQQSQSHSQPPATTSQDEQPEGGGSSAAA